MTSLSENDNHNLSFSDNESLPDSPVKRKCKLGCIQLLRAEELSEEQQPESYDRKLDTVEDGRNNETDDTVLKKQQKKNNIFTFRLTLKRRLQCSTLLKVVKEVIVIESDDE